MTKRQKRKCRLCKLFRDHYNSLRRACIGCERQYARDWEDKRKIIDPFFNTFSARRTNARAKGIPWTITRADLEPLPKNCPVLGIQLNYQNNKAKYDSPSIDRHIPGLGYIPGNVSIISHRANTIKSNALPEEIILVANYAKKVMRKKLNQ